MKKARTLPHLFALSLSAFVLVACGNAQTSSSDSKATESTTPSSVPASDSTPSGNPSVPSEEPSTEPVNPSTPSEEGEVAGLYTQVLRGERIWETLRSFQKSPSTDDGKGVFQKNTLVLTKGGTAMLRPTGEDRYPQIHDHVEDPITWDANQRRFELTKEFRMIDVGVHLTAIYYGTYSFEGNSVTLDYPEYASANYFYGTGWNGTEDYVCYMYRPGEKLQIGSSAHTWDPFEAWYGSTMTPSKSSIAPQVKVVNEDKMEITVNTENSTFFYDYEEAKIKADSLSFAEFDMPSYEGVANMYEQHLGTDELWSYLRSFYTANTTKEANSVRQDNTLVLTNGGGTMLRPTGEERYPQIQEIVEDPYTWDVAQKRYELTKEFRMFDVGVHLTVNYYGTYSFEGDKVVLDYPERASINYFYGTGWNGCEDYVCYMYQPGEKIKIGASAHTLDPFAGWYGSYFEPSKSTIAPQVKVVGEDKMDITVDKTNLSFSYDVEEAAKAQLA